MVEEKKFAPDLRPQRNKLIASLMSTLSRTYEAQHSVTKVDAIYTVNLVTYVQQTGLKNLPNF
jgi:hypothetical protein